MIKSRSEQKALVTVKAYLGKYKSTKIDVSASDTALSVS